MRSSPRRQTMWRRQTETAKHYDNNATSAPPAALTSNDAAIPILVPVAVELIAASALSMPGGARRCPARRAVLGRSVSRHREYPFVERDGGAMRDAGDVNLQPVGCLGDGQRPAALNAISRNNSKREDFRS
jgi:hypothetical protein